MVWMSLANEIDEARAWLCEARAWLKGERW